MHWGHVKSKDLIHWQELPIALAPDQAYDKGGCFSGSAIEKAGRLYLLYTGHVEEKGVVYQRQCLAVSEDGIHFEKVAQNPVIAETLLGDNGTIHDFRDPKVFLHEGNYYAVVATKSKENHGKILLFTSKDLLSWSFYSVLLEGNDKQGVMWECPDFFHLDGKAVLLLSSIQMPQRGYEFHNTSSSVAFIGTMDWRTGKFTPENYHEIDGGLDFYAPQTLVDDQNRRIMIAWMQMWHRTLPTHDLKHKWAGAMTLPRELHIKEERLMQRPVDFIQKEIIIDEKISEQLVNGSDFELTSNFGDNAVLKFVADLTDATKLRVQLAKNETGSLLLTYEKASQLLTICRADFGYAITGAEKPTLTKRSLVVPLVAERLQLEIFRDTSSLEIFVNNEKAMTITFYEIEKGSKIVINSQGQTQLSTITLGHISEN